jgi:hypothetical protein
MMKGGRMMRLARMMASAALCVAVLGSLPRPVGAQDLKPPTGYVPQGARVFPDGKTMLYDQSGNRGNVTPDQPPAAAPDASAKESTSPDAAANNSTGAGPAIVKGWQRPPAPPEVIAAWLDKCNPVSYEDSEHIKRVRFAAKDCDLTDPRQ